MSAERNSQEDFSAFIQRSFENNESREVSLRDQISETRRSLLSEDSTANDSSISTNQPLPTQKVWRRVTESSPGPQSASASKSNILTWIWREWLLEILACCLSLVSLVAIVVTLAIHDGRPLPQWPFGISVNALVSVFAVILKGSMMLPVSEALSQQKWSWFQKPRPLVHFADFDSASRGPWGSFKIIWKTHIKHLTSIGAAITILALASDPFIQQMVKYRPIAKSLDDHKVLFQRSNNFTRTGVHTGAGFSSLDLLTQAAIYKGAYDSYTPVKPTCLSGNCTFPEYRSLGMCSKCQDMTSSIKKNCTQHDKLEWCDWRLGSGLTLSIPSMDRLVMSTVVSDGMTSLDSNLKELSKTEVLGFVNETTLKVIAVECTLNPCVRTYTANVTQGETSETVLSTIQMAKPSNLSLGQIVNAGFFGTPMPCLFNGTYHDAGAFTERNSTNTIATAGLLPNNQTAYLPSDCVFAIGSPLGLSEYLADFLGGSVNYMRIGSPDWVGQLVYDPSRLNGGDTTVRTDFARVNGTWDALAQSLTVHMRQNGDTSNSEPATGIAFQMETCIQVQWPWIAYPVTLLTFAFAFLFVTIINSAKSTRRLVWKGSPLPLLLHGLDDEVRAEHREENILGDMESKARKLRVQMVENGDGMRLVKSQ